MASPDIKPIRLYTNSIADLHLGSKVIKKEFCSDIGFYILTPEQFSEVMDDQKMRESMFKWHRIQDYVTTYVIDYTNTDTVNFVLSLMTKYNIQRSHPITYIGRSCKSVDPLMWKCILDLAMCDLYDFTSVVGGGLCNTCILDIAINSLNDELLDQFINILSYIKFTDNVGEYAESIHNFIEKCIDNDNYKMCKYFIGQCTQKIAIIDIGKPLVYAVFSSKHEFADMILSFNKHHVIDGMYFTIKYPTIENCRFFHKLVIDDRIDVDEPLQDIYYSIKITPEANIYFITAFPFLERQSCHDEYTKKLVDEIANDNQELLKMIL